MERTRYLSTGQYSKLIGRSKPAIMRMINMGRIPGCKQVMMGKKIVWAIPADAPWPQTFKSIWEKVDLTDLVEEKEARKKPGPKPGTKRKKD